MKKKSSIFSDDGVSMSEISKPAPKKKKAKKKVAVIPEDSTPIPVPTDKYSTNDTIDQKVDKIAVRLDKLYDLVAELLKRGT